MTDSLPTSDELRELLDFVGDGDYVTPYHVIQLVAAARDLLDEVEQLRAQRDALHDALRDERQAAREFARWSDPVYPREARVGVAKDYDAAIALTNDVLLSVSDPGKEGT